MTFFQEEHFTILPKFICEECKHILENIIEFKNKCKERENEIREKIGLDASKIDNIKCEELSENEEHKTTCTIENIIIKEEEMDTGDECKPGNKQSFKKKVYKMGDRQKATEYPCKFCDKVYSKRSELNQHKNNDHLECPICLKSFVSFQKMSHHANNTHNKNKNVKKSVMCQLCGLFLSSNQGYQAHMRIHQNEKPYKCNDCDAAFRDHSTLRKHNRIHQNIRPYNCGQCPAKFKTTGALKTHTISIHETEKKHECQVCGKRTKMKYNLTIHMKSHGIGNKIKN